jgi:hypothetical protein
MNEQLPPTQKQNKQQTTIRALVIFAADRTYVRAKEKDRSSLRFKVQLKSIARLAN